MADNLDRFTKHARQVLQLAQEQAVRLNHNYIGTEHLLLGLVIEESGKLGIWILIIQYGLYLRTPDMIGRCAKR